MMNSNAHRIFLIGMMASGKSTIGKLLADKLGMKFVDMDAEIEADIGISISQIFADYGEEHFRIIESKWLKKFSTQSNIVISTGGGTPIYHNGMQIMLQTGRVVWLKVSKNNIYDRLQNNSTRPLAQKISKNNLSQMIHIRNQVYKQADIKVWNRGELYQVVTRITKCLQKSI